jgi:zinc and cadmium transporter
MERWNQMSGTVSAILLAALMSPILTSILLGLSAAAANVFGGAVIVQKDWDRSYLRYFVALGAGFMLATSLVEMVPESLSLEPRYGALLILVGYLLVHFFEHALTPHFHYGEETHADEFVHSHKRTSVLVGLMIHTFFDGIAITSGFLISSWLGWIIFLAVFLHKIPEGFTVTSVMLASGLSKRRSWFASVMLGLATLAGVLTMAIGRHQVSYGLPVAAGVTIYVAASDLIPEVNSEPGVKMALVVFVGVALLFLLDQVAHLH